MAWLNIRISRNPKPPFSFGRLNFSQEPQGIFFPSFLKPHQKLAYNLWTKTRWETETAHGICRNWLGHCFYENFFPPAENSLSFHPCTFLHTLSLMELNTFFLFFQIIDGSPRYFSRQGTSSIFFNIKDEFDSIPHLLLDIWAKRDSGLIIVNKLSRYFLIAREHFL